ncbi:BON domain-containing protein, partial [Moraxella oblonga]|uniref:BON domain-containing protein n=1 Tax=Moraxella oblonga TaxID=200413 RepID=UPI0008304F33
MNKFVVFAITTLSSTLMACSSAPTSNHINYGVPFVNRTLPERMIDEGIEHTVLRNLPNVAGMENIQNHQMRMAVDSFRREVLLTGEVPNPAISQNINTMIASMKDVTKIYNYLNIGTPRTQANTLQDNFLKSKILAKLATDRSVKSSQYKLVVRDNTVYVMGYLTQTQQNRIVEAIRQTQGVERVVLLSNLVTYLDSNPPFSNNSFNNNSFNNNSFNNNSFNNNSFNNNSFNN